LWRFPRWHYPRSRRLTITGTTASITTIARDSTQRNTPFAVCAIGMSDPV
jgi:hypothetical protein